MPDSVWVTPLTVTMTPRARGLEGHLQVVLDHHGEAAELLFLVVRIDCGLFDQRVQFFLAQFQHEREPRRKAALSAPPFGPTDLTAARRVVAEDRPHGDYRGQ